MVYKKRVLNLPAASNNNNNNNLQMKPTKLYQLISKIYFKQYTKIPQNGFVTCTSNSYSEGGIKKEAFMMALKRSASKINEQSWAADELIKQGEKLDPLPEEITFIDENYIKNPSQKVKNIVNDLLACNIAEVHQVMDLLQV